VFPDGLACFGAVSSAGCAHQPTVVGKRKPKDLPEFQWINTVLGNLKTSLSGSYHAFDFRKYATRYLARSPIDSTADSICARFTRDCSWLPPPVPAASAGDSGG
jgi:hypothetical protein